MALHLRSAVSKALQVNKTCQAAALSQLATSRKLKPEHLTSRFENNVVTSPHGDCQLHDMTMVQKVFESASRWPDKIAMVIILIAIN